DLDVLDAQQWRAEDRPDAFGPRQRSGYQRERRDRGGSRRQTKHTHVNLLWTYQPPRRAQGSAGPPPRRAMYLKRTRWFDCWLHAQRTTSTPASDLAPWMSQHSPFGVCTSHTSPMWLAPVPGPAWMNTSVKI